MMISLIIARLFAFVLRLFNRGATTLPGRVALRLKYNILNRLSDGVRIICVTGTNGKTTTCALIEHAFKKSGISYFINNSGANMLSGVATAFIMNSTLTGRCKKEFAIIECDENSFPVISRYLDAEITVVTNVFRDQLDRYGEVSKTLSTIRDSIKNMPKTVMVLNADDPLTFSLKTSCNNPCVTFGINTKMSVPVISDSRYCPICRTELQYRSHTLSQLGDFYCPACSYRRIKPDFEISEITETGFLLNGELYSTALGGLYNLYNICAAAAVINTIGNIDARSLCSFKGAFGRMERFKTKGGTALLLLVKNPAGLTGCIKYVCGIEGNVNMAFALNDNAADSKDVSWIWDSDFTPIKERCGGVYTLGTRAYDMALRLKYDGIETDEIIDGEGYRRLIDLINNTDGDFIIFATYTAMMKMRRLLIEVFGGKEFWQ